jgi:hypothetical protein
MACETFSVSLGRSDAAAWLNANAAIKKLQQNMTANLNFLDIMVPPRFNGGQRLFPGIKFYYFNFTSLQWIESNRIFFIGPIFLASDDYNTVYLSPEGVGKVAPGPKLFGRSPFMC